MISVVLLGLGRMQRYAVKRIHGDIDISINHVNSIHVHVQHKETRALAGEGLV